MLKYLIIEQYNNKPNQQLRLVIKQDLPILILSHLCKLNLKKKIFSFFIFKIKIYLNFTGSGSYANKFATSIANCHTHPAIHIIHLHPATCVLTPRLHLVTGFTGSPVYNY